VLTAGALVGRSRELLGILTAQETSGKTKVISAPVLLATDSIPAVMNVGQDVPTLSSSAATTATSSGSSLFANTISTRSSGVTLNVTARVNPSGVVTLLVDQEVSTPIPPEAGAAIQSPSFSTRTISTQVTVQDGDTVAIGESSVNRIPPAPRCAAVEPDSRHRVGFWREVHHPGPYRTGAVHHAESHLRHQLGGRGERRDQVQTEAGDSNH
jgi:hypothetical protein